MNTIDKRTRARVAEGIRSSNKSKPFNFDEFKALKAPVSSRPRSPDNPMAIEFYPYDAMRGYAHERLQYIDGGSAREAFVLTPRYALKVALNDKGVAQNKAEAKLSRTKSVSDAVAKTVTSDKDGNWVVAELVRPLVDDDEFVERTGITLDDLYTALSTGSYNWFPTKTRTLVDGLRKLKRAGLADDYRFEQFGITPDGRVVLLDIGFTKQVRNKFYS
jgi:hypothetical protein